MTNQKISGLTALTSVASTDLVEVVDVSDTSLAVTGTNKKSTISDLATAVISIGAVATDAEVSAAIAALSSVYQPLDSDLTAMAALSTTAFGRGFLILADAAAGRTVLGLGTIATQASSAVSISGGTITGITDLAVADGGTGSSTAANARTALGLAIGTDVQAYDPELAALAGLTSAADKIPYFTGSGTAALTTYTAAGRAMDGAADAAAQAVLLGAEVYKQVQTVNAQTGTTYTLVAGDAGKLVTLSNASAITLTVPQDSDATIAVGSYVDLWQLGAGQVTVAAGTGATLRVGGLTAKARAQYSSLGVQKVSANTWRLYGDMASA